MEGKKETGLHILLAEDDEEDHSLILKALQDCGTPITVTSVYNGLQLINFLLNKGVQRSHLLRVPDLILLDLHIPLIDGRAVLKLLKEDAIQRKIPVYILTGNACEIQREQIAGMVSGYFVKPSGFDELRNLMQTICFEAKAD